ncbi:hypothetical protein MHK_005848 [Candidatus Magnetomorum sp. HK-1]|nr:hypothetical protein MHK_005848 [Candidatus Magnetomorum sp. HK-1]
MFDQISKNFINNFEAIQSGDIVDFALETSKGIVDIAAELEIDGKTLHLKDLIIYPRGKTILTGLTREFLSLRTQLINTAKILGFSTLKITGKRVEKSTSANPGKEIDITICFRGGGNDD